MVGDAGVLSVRAVVPGAKPDRPRLDVRLSFDVGLTAVMGRSGAGKTTLLLTIAGLVRPATARITLGDAMLDDGAAVFVPPHRRRTALVFQTLALFPHLSAWKNVAYGLPRGPDDRDRALAWLKRARVEHLADRAPSTLSGGEAQRVALARALASEPRALLLDEPFSALDASLRAELGAELAALVKSLAIPAVLVTHHHEDAQTLTSSIIELEAGRVRA
ncbi:MAG: ATP-binding cassette domain-containing protein [Myxococcaceae bacterium]|nr:ATP-binding cassette domain-containing protein [Myxococcaceae bacterium]